MVKFLWLGNGLRFGVGRFKFCPRQYGFNGVGPNRTRFRAAISKRKVVALSVATSPSAES
jgi:hypothetical protein